jgi:hypothetical protein
VFLTRPIQGRKASVGATACCILHGFSQTGEHATDIFAQQNGNSDERQGDGGRDQAVFDSRDAIFGVAQSAQSGKVLAQGCLATFGHEELLRRHSHDTKAGHPPVSPTPWRKSIEESLERRA